MSLLNQIRAPKGATKSKKRLGRGESSGLGKTSGRGHKGQKARAGGYHKVGFEGGQMPLARRLPKRGFNNIFKKTYALVNLSDLNRLPAEVAEVSLELLIQNKILKGSARSTYGLKVLGKGELQRVFKVTAVHFSESARAKIEKAGGKAIAA